MHERIIKNKDGIWLIKDDSHLSRWVEEQGRLDHDRTIDRICDLIPVGGVVIDGGASIGDHTIAYARKVGPTGHVFAFEPNPAPFCCLTMNMAPYPWVHPLRLALRSQVGIGPFVIEQENVGNSRFQTQSDFTVPQVSLEALSGWFDLALNRMDFIKLDIEGSETLALDGMAGLIGRFRPILFVEINRAFLSEFDARSLLHRIALWRYDVRNFDPTKPDDLSGTQFDLLCTPK